MRISTRLGLFLAMMVLCLSPALNPAFSAALSDDGLEEKKLFVPSENLMGDHAAMLSAAMAEDRRLMIVIGANWCHDTSSFLNKIETNDETGPIRDGFRTMLVDVGAFDTQWEVLLDHYKMPTIYGTPTVLIVDPLSDTILNPISMHRWRNAANEDKSTIQEWLNKVMKDSFVEVGAHGQATKGWQDKALNRLDAFEREQAKRVRAGFRSMQMIFDTEDEQERAALNKRWDILAEMRYDLISFLRKKRSEIVAPDAVEGVVDFELPALELFDDL